MYILWIMTLMYLTMRKRLGLFKVIEHISIRFLDPQIFLPTGGVYKEKTQRVANIYQDTASFWRGRDCFSIKILTGFQIRIWYFQIEKKNNSAVHDFLTILTSMFSFSISHGGEEKISYWLWKIKSELPFFFQMKMYDHITFASEFELLEFLVILMIKFGSFKLELIGNSC